MTCSSTADYCSCRAGTQNLKTSKSWLAQTLLPHLWSITDIAICEWSHLFCVLCRWAWCLPCGFNSIVPYFYVIYFGILLGMSRLPSLLHRVSLSCKVIRMSLNSWLLLLIRQQLGISAHMPMTALDGILEHQMLSTPSASCFYLFNNGGIFFAMHGP